ncbi:MAG TPA: enoyl-CoA hydratase-related protein [Actinomycetales bacterium]|nr:enoyl-CoA hydratase-related protein [Actinomycetales bacterium]
MTTEPVRYEQDGGLATITFNRPDAMNALDTATKESLRTAVLQAAEDSTVRCVLLTGTGRAFCVGQDLREHIGLLRAGDESLWRTVPEHYNPVAKTLATMPKPVVAALNGVAAGAGASIAMAADIRVVAESAGFNLAFAGIALSCDTGSSWWLPRLVGMAKAKELLMMPRTVKAEEALRLGLATEVVPDDKLVERGLEVARMLADGPTQAYAALRQSVVYAASHDLETSLDREAELMALTGGTADHHEAVDAFVAKRKPDFSGR